MRPAIAIIATIIAAILTSVGGIFQRGCNAGYENIKGMPPRWVFMVVWPILFFLIGWAGYLILRDTQSIGRAILFFSILLLLVVWPYIFWGICSQGSFAIALLVIGVTIVLGIMLIIVMVPKNALVSVLILPLIIWLSYAFYLNFQIAMNE